MEHNVFIWLCVEKVKKVGKIARKKRLFSDNMVFFCVKSTKIVSRETFYVKHGGKKDNVVKLDIVTKIYRQNVIKLRKHHKIEKARYNEWCISA